MGPEGKISFKIPGIVVIEENSPHSPLFLAVGNIKIIARILGKFGVEMGAERIKGVLGRLVKMEGVLFEGKAHWGQVVAPREPEAFLCPDITDIHVDSGGVGIFHMGDQADAGGKKGAGAIAHGKGGAGNARPVDGGFFENISSDEADFPAAARSVLPWHFLEADARFETFKPGYDFIP